MTDPSDLCSACATAAMHHERFMSKVSPDPNSKCWLWTAYVGDFGYGEFHLNGKTIRSHRVAYELYVGPIPSGKCVLHRCDVPRCVNPSHLFLGTHADNVADKILKDRGRWGTLRGESHGRAKLKTEQIQTIRHLAHEGLVQRAIAKRFCISPGHVSRIVRGESWGIIL